MSAKDGGPAFPVSFEAQMASGGKYLETTGGMTLRDWLAGQALSGLMGERFHVRGMGTVKDAAPVFAMDAYRIADAMLAERERGR